ncbi:hypothetical protein ABAC460_18345 [Asticcacaulis sp. AC460]|uniref:phospholipase D family protein n=1 Tax=Asticcacaulis sp. AC460 TaxID=1282360 RepID=UPI0003C40BC3|nr:phospholipase D family protein [Asticcacaulis sp. AC460]ESQ87636.1 hypothetical protein ABAC460_18345 [Asticcacaulis sp. AC460]
MEITLLDAQGTANKLIELINRHEKIDFAVAWATSGKVADCLLKNQDKFSTITIGLNRFVTEPAFLEELIGVKNAFVIKSDKGTFHPKIYHFVSANTSETIVGSSNFTGGGLGGNLEASFHIKGESGEDIFRQVEAQLNGYKKYRRNITKELVDSYRDQYELNKARQGRKNPHLPGDPGNAEALTSELLAMSWAEYCSELRHKSGSSISGRFKILRRAREMFETVGSMAELEVKQWRAIAGLLTEKQKEEDDARKLKLHDIDWGWFGSMGGSGTFQKLINSRNRNLAKAVDSIPLSGEVCRNDFDTFAKHFGAAFKGGNGATGVSTATRLLAMKRPDVFMCVDGKNKKRLKKALGSSVTLENYWDTVVETVRTAPWYTFDCPTEKTEQKIWKGRVALLDAIFYEE